VSLNYDHIKETSGAIKAGNIWTVD